MFRRQIITLWHAFWHPATPFYLKAIMVAVVTYVISPIDLLPDFFLGLGLIDDVLLLAFAVNWIVGRLPAEVFETPQKNSSRPDNFRDDDNTIDGSSRRL